MTLEGNKKQVKKEKLNEKALIYLLSKKGSAKEKIYENRIHDVFDEKAKAKAKSKLEEKVVNSEVLKNTISEFNKFDTITKRFPTISEVKKKLEYQKNKLIKEEEERIDKAFEKKKSERVKKAAELSLREINDKLKSKTSKNISEINGPKIKEIKQKDKKAA